MEAKLLNSMLGCGSAFFYAIVSALARVFIEHVGTRFNPLLTLLFCLFIAIIFFNLVNINKIIQTYKILFQYKKVWFYVMLTTMITWVAFFLGPIYIGADHYAILVFATGGLIGVTHYCLTTKRYNMLIMIICILYFAAIYLSITAATISYNHIIGFMLALLSGISLFFYSKYSSHLQWQSGLSTSATLGARFWLAIIILFILCFSKLNQFAQISLTVYELMLMLAFFGIIASSYLILTAAVKVGPQIATVISSVSPFFTVVFVTLILGRHFSTLDIIAATIIVVAVILFQVAVSKKKISSELAGAKVSIAR